MQSDASDILNVLFFVFFAVTIFSIGYTLIQHARVQKRVKRGTPLLAFIVGIIVLATSFVTLYIASRVQELVVQVVDALPFLMLVGSGLIAFAIILFFIDKVFPYFDKLLGAKTGTENKKKQ